MLSKLYFAFIMILTLILTGCQDEPLNDPYPQFMSDEKIFFSAFTSSPKHLDPAISYTQDEAIFTFEIYEPPLQYHYLKRPYELVPLTTVKMPSVKYINQEGKEINELSDNVAYSIYTIEIKPNIFYQEHPAFAKMPGTEEYRYHHMAPSELKGIHSIKDFEYTGTRELSANDYIYEIKRLADPSVNSPIFGVMVNYIVGFKEFNENLQIKRAKDKSFINLNDIPLEGVKLINPYTYEIKLKGKYPQFKHWLAMPFFSPIPWEAMKFYSQPLLQKRNITLDWFPVGTGPFILAENNPNMIMILDKNKNFHGETYPEEGEPGDEAAGYLINKGKPLPLVDKLVFVLEKEGIPYWNKFLQGYYDLSLITNINFDQALKSMNEEGIELTDLLKEKKITPAQSVQGSVFYWGFNMFDPIVGGYSEKQKKLRKAFSLAFDMGEYINIFLNGTGEIAENPIPEGIFGHAAPSKNNQMDISEAKKLLTEAGYKNGIDPKTGRALQISMDVPSANSPDAAAQFGWMRKQFEKLGVELVIKATQFSRFLDIIQNGDEQIYALGWIADYPDPENFMFLFDSENGKVKYLGENTSNYSNAEFDKLFRQMKVMPDDQNRLNVINQMSKILEEDKPWMAAYSPMYISLRQQWISPAKPNPIARNTLKYLSIDPALRVKCQKAWNQPILWPVWLIILCLILLCLPAVGLYYVKTYRRHKLKKTEVRGV